MPLALDTNTTNNTTPLDQKLKMLLCDACRTSLLERRQRQGSVEEQWRIYNSRRRDMSLPATSLHAFESEIEDGDNDDQNTRSGSSSPTPHSPQCLLCAQSRPSSAQRGEGTRDGSNRQDRRSRSTTPDTIETPRSTTPEQTISNIRLTPAAIRALTASLEIEPRPSSGRILSRHEEMSISGLSLQQRATLAAAEKKAQRSEAVARRATEWISAKGANCQKFDQLNNQMKWGKQNHKLMPR